MYARPNGGVGGLNRLFGANGRRWVLWIAWWLGCWVVHLGNASFPGVRMCERDVLQAGGGALAAAGTPNMTTPHLPYVVSLV